MMCAICKKRLKNGQHVIQVLEVVGNESRGDFVSDTSRYIHIEHLHIARPR
jgi:hypothetical protein